MALLSLRAAMTAAPRFCTVLIKSSLWPEKASFAPLAVALEASGNCVEEWLPQMTTFSTEATGTWFSRARSAVARFWSSRVMAVKLRAGILSLAK